MTKKIFTDEEWNAIKNNGAFCPAPFFSYYIDTNNKLSACCIQNAGNNKFAPDIVTGVPLKETYNHQNFIEMRRDLVSGVKNKQCERCWMNEEINTRSMRNGMLDWMHQWSGAEEYVRNAITEEHTVEEPVIHYIDIRFDNTCNLRCRTCFSHYSTSWYPEEKEYHSQFPDKIGKMHMAQPIQFTSANVTVEELKPNLRTAKRIYFAGGEPLITPQHYEILDYLIEIGHTDVDLYYNTNFSKLTHSKFDVIEYWKKFKRVSIGASLDGSHERGEYIRKNISWAKVVANRERMIAEVPHVRFLLSPTISIMSVYNILDFHREWVEKKYIGPYDLNINLLFGPPAYNIKSLPEHHKEKLRVLYAEHIEWIKSFKPTFEGRKNKHWFHDEFSSVLDPWLCVDGFENVLSLLNQEPDPKWKSYWDKNQWLDMKRGEDFYKVFPEYEDLRTVIVDYGYNKTTPTD
jgi:organic radical activating enzyme